MQKIRNEQKNRPALFGQALTALGAAVLKNLAAICRRHTLAESVNFFAFDLCWGL